MIIIKYGPWGIPGRWQIKQEIENSMADDKLVEIPKFKIDGFSLTMDFGATKPEWEKAGRLLGRLGKASTFWTGDWHIAGVNAGFTRGDLYDEAERLTGLGRETLQNAVWLSKSVTPERRRTDLTPSHHKEVAALDPQQQEKMLEQAATNHWTKRELHDHVQGKLPVSTIPAEPHVVRLARELFDWVQKARDIPLFADVVAAADKLATSGKRTDFPK
jgi:hypothetical protein